MRERVLFDDTRQVKRLQKLATKNRIEHEINEKRNGKIKKIDVYKNKIDQEIEIRVGYGDEIDESDGREKNKEQHIESN